MAVNEFYNNMPVLSHNFKVYERRNHRFTILKFDLRSRRAQPAQERGQAGFDSDN
jgi:hypothetical protein